jgi:hypothetical protein
MRGYGSGDMDWIEETWIEGTWDMDRGNMDGKMI